MDYSPRVYVSAPYKALDSKRDVIKRSILGLLIGKYKLEPQEFGVSGLPMGDDWSFERAVEVMQQCDGSLVLALARFFSDEGIPIPTEYSHFEGALSVAANLPTLVVAEQDMIPRGILKEGGSLLVLKVPVQEYRRPWDIYPYLEEEPPFKRWIERIRNRYDVFFGYCSKANALANNIKNHLREKGLAVLDWATEFRPGRTIMQEVARSAAICRCGLFLFTADDPIDGNQTHNALPRDNVLLEAGYFMNARGSHKVIIVREKGTKMPADLGGIIYLSIEDRDSWQAIAQEIEISIKKLMSSDVA